MPYTVHTTRIPRIPKLIQFRNSRNLEGGAVGEERTRADSPNSEIGRTSEVAGVFGGRTWVRVRGEATRFQSRGRPLRQYVQSVVLHRCLQAIIMFGRRPVCAAAVLTLSLPLRACETACCFSCCRVVFVTSPARGSEQGSPLRRGSQSRGHFPGKGVGAGVASPARGSQQGSPPRRGGRSGGRLAGEGVGATLTETLAPGPLTLAVVAVSIILYVTQ